MKKEYKLNKRLLIKMIFMFLVGCLGIAGFYSLLTGQIPHAVVPTGTSVSLDLMIGMLCIIMIVVGFSLAITDFFYGNFYSKITYLQMVDLDPQLYDNMLVLSHKNYAWSFTYKFKEIAIQSEIRSVFYYTRKKKLNAFKFIPITT